MSELQHASGVLVRVAPYSETSMITTWVTRPHGLVHLMVRGGRKRRSRQVENVDLLDSASLTYQSARCGTLHTAREIRVTRHRRTVAVHYGKQLSALYAYEVLALLVETDTPIDAVVELYEAMLDYLETHEPSFKLIERFERGLFSRLGLPHESAGIELCRQQHYPRAPKCWNRLRDWLKAESR
ncbi:MAG: DNA repair protein RecO [Candidatus Methylacidiphilales bacterium]